MELMIQKSSAALAALLTVGTLTASFNLPAQADTYSTGVTKNTSKTKQFFQKHDAVRKATIGAGVGTAAGAVTGLISGKGMVRGAAIGAGTGATVGVINSSKVMARHPIMKDVATGTATAAGLAMTAVKGHGSTKKTMEGAAIGAGLGLAAGLLKDKLK